jgi:hypothetical protein
MAVGATAGCIASGYLFDHYFLLLLPPLWLIAAILIRCSTSPDSTPVFAATLAGSSLMLAAPGLAFTAKGAGDLLLKLVADDLRADPPRMVARLARQHMREGDYFYGVCTPLVLTQLLHARMPTRYPFYSHHLDPAYAAALGVNVDQEVKSIFAKKPAVVAIGDWNACYHIPHSSWLTVRSAIAANGYRPFARYGAITLYEAARP